MLGQIIYFFITQKKPSNAKIKHFTGFFVATKNKEALFKNGLPPLMW